MLRLEKILVEGFLTFLVLTGGGVLFSSFRGLPWRLQKNTDNCWGKPGVLVSIGGDPSRDLLAGGGVVLTGAGGLGGSFLGRRGADGGGGGGGGGKEYVGGAVKSY